MVGHRRRGTRARSIVIAACATAGMALYARGADTWDNSSGDALWATASNWADNTVPAAGDSVTFPAGFPNSDTTVTLPLSAQALSLIINDSYTLSGGSVTLGAGGSLSVASAKTATITTNLSGTNGLTKSGSGTLVLNTSNAFSGAVNVNAGVLSLGLDNRFGNSGNGVTISGGTLAPTGSFSTLRSFTLGASGATIAVASGNLFTIMNALAANGNSLVANGGGTLALSSASSRTGSTTIQGGVLRVEDGAALGTGNVSVSLGGTLELNTASDSQPMTVASGGTVRAAGVSTYSGTITVAGSSIVTLSAPSSSDSLTIGDAANDYTGGSSSTSIGPAAAR